MGEARELKVEEAYALLVKLCRESGYPPEDAVLVAEKILARAVEEGEATGCGVRVEPLPKPFTVRVYS